MNPREMVLKALKHEEPERVPLGPETGILELQRHGDAKEDQPFVFFAPYVVSPYEL